MKARAAVLAIAIAWALGAASCSKASKAVAPQPPAPVVASDYEYSLRLSSQEGTFTITRAEYADANGIVQQVNFQRPVWVQTVSLKPGQRMYLRAEVTFTSMFYGAAQIVATDFYRGSLAERADGPSSATVVVDQILQ